MKNSSYTQLGDCPVVWIQKKFAAALKREILEFGYSQDTAATDVRYDVICYLLTHTEDEKGFSLGKTMAEMWMKGCKPEEVRKYQDIVLMYCGMAINHLENVEEKTDGE